MLSRPLHDDGGSAGPLPGGDGRERVVHVGWTWEFLLAHKVEPWTELPIWVPAIGDLASFYTTGNLLALRSAYMQAGD